MPEISFALILSENLGNTDLRIRQIESVIRVTGALDPYQIQKIRDHVSDSFHARRQAINALIAGKARQAARTRDPKKKQDIIARLDTALAQSTAAFDRKIQASITAFCEKDAELAQAAGTGGWSCRVSTAWDPGALLWTGADAAAAPALKTLFDLCQDFEKLCATQADAWRGLDAQEKHLEAALDTLEKSAHALAVTLDALLKEQIARRFPDEKIADQIEKTVQAAVTDLAELGGVLARKRKAQTRAGDSIRSATTQAGADPRRHVARAHDSYASFNATPDLSKPVENLRDAARQLKMTVSKAMEDSEE